MSTFMATRFPWPARGLEAKLASLPSYLQTPPMGREGTKRAELVADEVRQLFGALSRRLRAESAELELSSSEVIVLRRLHEHGPSTTAALARAEYVKPQSMGATL